MKLAACIFARGGSKGVPGKNIRNFAGKPLIAWAIEQALSVESVDEIYVSTDSMEIASIARNYGAVVPFVRPSELALDNSPEWKAWQHFLLYLFERDGKFPDALLSVPTTTPLRSSSDIQACLDVYKPGITDAVVTVTDAHRNPYFNMVTLDGQGFAKKVLSDETGIARRQDAPIVFDMTTAAYVVDSQFVMKHSGIFEGRIKAVHIPLERAVDIDSLIDFQFAEFLYRYRIDGPK